MGRIAVWLFGRGASMACGLGWSVPSELRTRDREEQIPRIKACLLAMMNESTIDTSVYKQLLSILATSTNPQWSHLLATTNWDFLLQREVDMVCPNERPRWLTPVPGTSVLHLNGTIEPGDSEFRSDFVLETDPPEIRMPKVEFNKARSIMQWEAVFIVVGMSFECGVDQSILALFHRDQDEVPIGESEWIIVNPDPAALEQVAKQVSLALPRNTGIQKVQRYFDKWLDEGMPQLREMGILDV